MDRNAAGESSETSFLKRRQLNCKRGWSWRRARGCAALGVNGFPVEWANSSWETYEPPIWARPAGPGSGQFRGWSHKSFPIQYSDNSVTVKFLTADDHSRTQTSRSCKRSWRQTLQSETATECGLLAMKAISPLRDQMGSIFASVRSCWSKHRPIERKTTHNCSS